MPHSDQTGVPVDQEARIREIQAKPYWDYSEVATMLHVEVKTIRNMKWKREITFTKFGRKVYFPRDIILREMRGNLVRCTMLAAARRSQAEGDVA